VAFSRAKSRWLERAPFHRSRAVHRALGLAAPRHAGSGRVQGGVRRNGWGWLCPGHWLLLGACSLRGLDDLEGPAPLEDGPAEILSLATLPDGGVCGYDAECADGRCVEEHGTCEPCPADMRLVRFAAGDAFCMDVREVSRAEYAEFTSAALSPAPVAALRDPTMCARKPSFAPGDGANCRAEFRTDAASSLPITCVDLCDAMAYCSWKGRRVCGGPSGVKLGPRRIDTPADEWLTACTERGARAFPYGDTFEPVCNVASDALVSVDARDDCTTPSGITQLSGNVAEWVMQCRTLEGVERCLVRGGEFRTQDLSTVGCWLPPEGVDGTVPSMALTPLERSPGVGIRCCSD